MTGKMKIRKNHVLWGGAMMALLMTSCQGGRTSVDVDGEDTLQLKYAQLLTIVKHGGDGSASSSSLVGDGYAEVVVANPWKQGAVLHRYILVPKGKEGDETVATLAKRRAAGAGCAVDTVRTPVENSVVFTSPHCQLMYELGAKEDIRGVCDLDYINIPDVKRRAALAKGASSKSMSSAASGGAIVDCGSSMAPDIERIIALKPEALLISPFENSGGYGKLDKLHVPIIETADYMETSPLGRAEWIKFYGLLFLGEGADGGGESRADSLFASIEHSYLSLRSMAARLPLGRSILTERKTGGVWYVPGGKSTVGVLLADAHARYVFAHDDHSGSLALSPEQVIEQGANIDVWALKYFGSRPVSRGELLQEYSGYAQLKAMQTGEVYEASTSNQPYFEQTSFHPERLLREFIILAHPDFHKLGQLKYYRKE